MNLPDRIANWLREHLDAAGAEGFVFGLSGGVDSATAAALAVRAVGAENTLGVLGKDGILRICDDLKIRSRSSLRDRSIRGSSAVNLP